MFSFSAKLSELSSGFFPLFIHTDERILSIWIENLCVVNVVNGVRDGIDLKIEC